MRRKLNYPLQLKQIVGKEVIEDIDKFVAYFFKYTNLEFENLIFELYVEEIDGVFYVYEKEKNNLLVKINKKIDDTYYAIPLAISKILFDKIMSSHDLNIPLNSIEDTIYKTINYSYNLTDENNVDSFLLHIAAIFSDSFNLCPEGSIIKIDERDNILIDGVKEEWVYDQYNELLNTEVIFIVTSSVYNNIINVMKVYTIDIPEELFNISFNELIDKAICEL